MKDAVDALLVNTLKHRKLTVEDMNMQNAMVASLAELADLIKPQGTALSLAGSQSLTSIEEELVSIHKALEDMESNASCGAFCSHSHDAVDPSNSYFRQNNDLPSLSGAIARPLAMKELKRIISIYKNARSSADSRSRAFYDYQIEKVERLMKTSR